MNQFENPRKLTINERVLLYENAILELIPQLRSLGDDDQVEDIVKEQLIKFDLDSDEGLNAIHQRNIVNTENAEQAYIESLSPLLRKPIKLVVYAERARRRITRTLNRHGRRRRKRR